MILASLQQMADPGCGAVCMVGDITDNDGDNVEYITLCDVLHPHILQHVEHAPCIRESGRTYVQVGKGMSNQR